MKTVFLRNHSAGAVITAAILLIISNLSYAEVISGTQINFFKGGGSNQYGANVLQTPTFDITGVLFAYTPTTLQITTSAVDEESDWYLVNAGDSFSAATIAANSFPILFTTDHLRPPVSIPLGNFYLGVNTGEFPDVRGVYGWLELHNDGTQLTAVANAVDYGDGGIFVGTTTAVPEPASAAILLLALPLLTRRRSRRSHPGVRPISRNTIAPDKTARLFNPWTLDPKP